MKRYSLYTLFILSILANFYCAEEKKKGLLPLAALVAVGQSASATTTSASTTTVASPTFSPSAGTYTQAQNVTITSTTSGAEIRYTTDGSDPTCSTGTIYSSAVNVAQTITMKAIGCKTGMTASSVIASVYTISGNKKIFITTSTTNGNIGGISGADTKCSNDASKPSGGGTYKAFLVDGTNRKASNTANAGDGQVDWVLQANTTYYRADGTTVIGTTNSVKLFTFPLTSSISTGLIQYFTGLNTDWTTSNHCNNWSQNTGQGSTVAGTTLTNNTILTTSPTGNCALTLNLVCVEQ